MKHLLRALTYARVSSDDRLNDGRNIILGQLDLCREHVARKGYFLVDEIAEDERGASGYAMELPGLEKVLVLARSGHFDVLVVREIDRLARNLVKQLLIEQELRSLGVTIEYVLGEYPDNPEGRLNKHIKAVIAEYEREKIVQRTQRGRRIKVAGHNHVSTGGHVPYGYRIKVINEQKQIYTLEIHQEESQVVQLIFELYTRPVGSLSLRQIALKLSEMRVPTYVDTGVRPRLTTKKKAYGQWNPRAVRTILRNPVYVGRWYYGKGKRDSTRQVLNPPEHWIEVPVPAVVPPDVFTKAQDRIAKNRKFGQTVQHEYLMARRLVCQCQERIHSLHYRSHNRDYFYYRCPCREDPKNRYKSKTCSLPSFRVKLVDDAVWRWLKQLIASPEKMEEALSEFQFQQSTVMAALELQAATTKTSLKASRDELKRLIEVYVTTGSTESRTMLSERQQTLEHTIAALSEDLYRLEDQIEAISAQISQDQLLVLAEFIGKLNYAFTQDDEPFYLKLQLIELFDVQGRLVVENDVKIVYITTIITPETFGVELHTSQTPLPSTGEPA